MNESEVCCGDGGGYCTEASNDISNSSSQPPKRSKLSHECIIHCTESKEAKLVSPKDSGSWQTLLKAAIIRQHEPLLQISKTLPENVVPNIVYHRQCRSLFTMKRDLDQIVSLAKDETNQSTEKPEERLFHRLKSTMSDPSSRVYNKICIVCDKKMKYIKRTNNKEPLTKCVQLRCDHAIRKAATEQKDTRILALASRDLVAAEAHYHRSCYRDFTRKFDLVDEKSIDEKELEDEPSYEDMESSAYDHLFDVIRDLFESPRVVRLTELTQVLVVKMNEYGVTEVRQSTKKHIRRKLEIEFGSSVHFVPDVNGKQLVYPDKLTISDLVRDVIRLKGDLETITKESDAHKLLQKSAQYLRKDIQDNKIDVPWPPLPSDVHSCTFYIPGNLKLFLYYLIGGEKDSASPRAQRLVDSVGQDLVYGVTCAKVTPPKHILLPYAVKKLTGSTELIRIIGRGIFFSLCQYSGRSLLAIEVREKNIIVSTSKFGKNTLENFTSSKMRRK